MYEQVEASRNALSSQLSDARRCISALQVRYFLEKIVYIYGV